MFYSDSYEQMNGLCVNTQWATPATDLSLYPLEKPKGGDP